MLITQIAFRAWGTGFQRGQVLESEEVYKSRERPSATVLTRRNDEAPLPTVASLKRTFPSDKLSPLHMYRTEA